MIGRHMYVLLLSMCVYSFLLKKYFGPTAQHVGSQSPDQRYKDFPGGLVGKESACNARNAGRC